MYSISYCLAKIVSLFVLQTTPRYFLFLFVCVCACVLEHSNEFPWNGWFKVSVQVGNRIRSTTRIVDS